MKPGGRVEVVQDENKDTSVGNNVFQVIEMVESYRVAPLIDLEENSNFHVFDNSLVDVDVDVDAEELNIVLSSNGQAQIDENDDDINIEDCDEADDDSIEEEEDTSD
jgi:hypothetical protein